MSNFANQIIWMLIIELLLKFWSVCKFVKKFDLNIILVQNLHKKPLIVAYNYILLHASLNDQMKMDLRNTRPTIP